MSNCVNITEQRNSLEQCKYEFKHFQWNDYYRADVVAKSIIIKLINICEVLLSCLEVKVIRIPPPDYTELELEQIRKYKPKRTKQVLLELLISLVLISVCSGGLIYAFVSYWLTH